MIRTFSGSRPSRPDDRALGALAPWLGIQAVSRPSSPHAAAAERDSIGAAATRRFWMTSLTTTSQPANRSGLLPAASPKVQTTLVPAAGNSSPFSADSASFMSTTAGSGS